MNLCLIGGGHSSAELLSPAIESQGVERSMALIIPSACSTEKSYDRKVESVLKRFEELGVATSVLHEFAETPTSEKLDDAFGSATMMYVIGGNSPYFYETVRAQASGQRIQQATLAEKLLAGTSAGALAPFKVAHINPAKRPETEDWDFALQPMLGLVDAAATAHANQFDARPHNKTNRLSRLQDFSERFIETGLSLGFGIDSDAAIHATAGSVEVLSNETGSTVHVLSMLNGGVRITPCLEPSQLQELSAGVFSHVG
jgi:peptidase E